MEIRRAGCADWDCVVRIYREARAYMKANGNPNQWGDAYPPEALILADLRAGQLYVCTEGESILGVFCYFFGEDATYRKIEGGQWLNDRPYGVLHRIAVAEHGRGVAAFCFADCLDRCGNLRIDTHRDNLPMQRALARNGFTYCGIVHLENGAERLAYQKEQS